MFEIQDLAALFITFCHHVSIYIKILRLQVAGIKGIKGIFVMLPIL